MMDNTSTMSPSQAPSTDVIAVQSTSKEQAASTVFNITELAERIFLELPLGDLLIRVPRVCKHWKAVVDSSPQLQQALFFAPVTSTTKDIIANPFFGPGEIKIQKRYRVEREYASWRRMLPSQPPHGHYQDCVTEPAIWVSASLDGVVEGLELNTDFPGWDVDPDIKVMEGGRYLHASTKSLATELVTGSLDEWKKRWYEGDWNE